MQIALIGYGKMGRAIEEIAIGRNHQIGLTISSSNKEHLTTENLRNCDVAIEFTNPHSAVENIRHCIDAGVPVVCGSTGWLERWAEVEAYCKQKNGSLLYASNFSIGVNIFFEVNKRLASLMALQPQYNVEIEEIHHTAKKDAPSGTAISLAEQIINNNPLKKGWAKEQINDSSLVSIFSKRIDPAPGTHHVRYKSAIDDIEIIHTAHNRSGFASGAVLAAEFIKGKKGIFSMKEVLHIQ
ncbi:MAG: 4-hydroxy-tetrahydrodipicolinate reductase [Ferruginibacter sp.]